MDGSRAESVSLWLQANLLRQPRFLCRVLYYCDAAGDCPEDMPATSIQPGVAANVFAVVGNTAQAPLVETPSGLPDLARESAEVS